MTLFSCLLRYYLVTLTFDRSFVFFSFLSNLLRKCKYHCRFIGKWHAGNVLNNRCVAFHSQSKRSLLNTRNCIALSAPIPLKVMILVYCLASVRFANCMDVRIGPRGNSPCPRAECKVVSTYEAKYKRRKVATIDFQP